MNPGENPGPKMTDSPGSRGRDSPGLSSLVSAQWREKWSRYLSCGMKNSYFFQSSLECLTDTIAFVCTLWEIK